jgi:cholesterol transport system auxiliary component
MRSSIVVLCLLLSGCALTNKSDALDVRWFTPEHVKPQITSARTNDGATPLPLELGRVRAGSELREKIVFRDARWEVGYYEDRRWTERPEEYVRRALGRTLFEERGFARSISDPNAAVLEIELLAFEELRAKPVHAARVQLRVIVHDGRDVLHEETVTVDKPLPENDASMEAFVAAMADALDASAAIVADRTQAVLRRKRTQ